MLGVYKATLIFSSFNVAPGHQAVSADGCRRFVVAITVLPGHREGDHGR